MKREKISAWVKINEVCTVHVRDIYKWLVGRTGQFEIIPDADYPRYGKVIYQCTLKTQTITTECDYAPNGVKIMSLDKAIKHKKEKRKPYRGAKSIDPTCRNHGSCPWCKGNRTFSNRRRKPVEEEVEEEIEEVVEEEEKE